MTLRNSVSRLMMITLSTGSLAACATASCDPNTAGFIGGLGNSMSGCYTATENRQRATLAQERSRMQQAMDEARRAQNSADDAQFRQMAVAAQLANLSQSNAELQRRLDAARARQSADQNAVQAAQEQLDRLQRERNTLPATPQAREQLRRQQEALDRLMTTM